MIAEISLRSVLETEELDGRRKALRDVATHAVGPEGMLPLTPEMLVHRAVRESFWLEPERRHGLGTGAAARS